MPQLAHHLVQELALLLFLMFPELPLMQIYLALSLTHMLELVTHSPLSS